MQDGQLDGDPGALAGDAARARDAARGEEMTTGRRAPRVKMSMHVFRGDSGGRGVPRVHGCRSRRAWSSSTSFTASRATQANDLAVRWNCKAGKCGSCSAEVNGKPRLMCMTRMDIFPEGEPITVAPLKTFPLIKDLVTDVSFNYEAAKQIPALPAPAARGRRHLPDDAGGHRPRAGVPEVHRVLPLPERLPRDPGPRGEQAAVLRAALLRAPGRARHAPARHRGSPRARSGRARASASATSRSAAPRSAPSTSRSPTTRSSR